MAEQDTWLESRVGKEIRVFLAAYEGEGWVGFIGILEAVEGSGLVVGGQWFNRMQIAYVEDKPEGIPQMEGIQRF